MNMSDFLLHEVVAASQFKRVIAILKRGANVNFADKNGFTPLLIAASKGYLKIVKILIKNKANINTKSNDGVTALMYAAIHGYLEIAKELIEHVADVNASDKDGVTALMFAAENGHFDIVKELIKHVAGVNASNKDSVTALIFAAQNGHFDIVKELTKNVTDVNASNKNGDTALMLAAENGHLDIVKELIEHAADVNASNKNGVTALIFAAQNGHFDIVKKLIKHAADANASNKDGGTALMLAAQNGHFDIVKELIKHAADVNASNKDGGTALLVAAGHGHFKITEILLEHAANINCSDKHGIIPVVFASEGGYKDIVALFCDKICQADTTAKPLIDIFNIISQLGKGGYGNVLEVKQRSDNTSYALKIIKLPQRIENICKMLKEVRNLFVFKHPHVIKYYTSWIDNTIPDFTSDNLSHLQMSFESTATEETGSYTSNYQGKTDYKSEISSEKTKTNLKNDKTKNIYFFILMELCDKMTLADWMELTEIRPKEIVYKIYLQILSAVAKLHFHKTIHRDLKPTNIFFKLNCTPDKSDICVKLGDFGLVTQLEFINENSGMSSTSNKRELTKYAGTKTYMAPEQKETSDYDTKVDIYALGIILFEMLVYFGTQSERSNNISNLKQGKFPENFSKNYPQEFTLIKRMLSTNPKERPNVNDVVASVIKGLVTL